VIVNRRVLIILIYVIVMKYQVYIPSFYIFIVEYMGVRMEELYVYNIDDNLYFNNSCDISVRARNLHSNKQYVISRNNDLHFIAKSTPNMILMSRIILLSTDVKSQNILINVSIPFYSKTILRLMTNTFNEIYILMAYPFRNNYGATFSIIVPLIHTLNITTQYVRDRISNMINENFRIVRSNFVHIFSPYNGYKSLVY